MNGNRVLTQETPEASPSPSTMREPCLRLAAWNLEEGGFQPDAAHAGVPISDFQKCENYVSAVDKPINVYGILSWQPKWMNIQPLGGGVAAAHVSEVMVCVWSWPGHLSYPCWCQVQCLTLVSAK